MRVIMASETVLKFEMCLPGMALGALGNLAVDGVTGRTVKGAVFALDFPELGVLLCVAGKTNPFVR